MITIKPPSPPWQLKVFPIMTFLGWVFILTAFAVGIFVLTPTAVSYLSGNAKAVRDAAEVGSPLLTQLQTLTTIPRWLEPLAFLGVASFMVGIALEFSSIPAVLKNRGEVMKACFPLLRHNGGSDASK
jgi:hypothetical protein